MRSPGVLLALLALSSALPAHAEDVPRTLERAQLLGPHERLAYGAGLSVSVPTSTDPDFFAAVVTASGLLQARFLDHGYAGLRLDVIPVVLRSSSFGVPDRSPAPLPALSLNVGGRDLVAAGPVRVGADLTYAYAGGTVSRWSFGTLGARLLALADAGPVTVDLGLTASTTLPRDQVVFAQEPVANLRTVTVGAHLGAFASFDEWFARLAFGAAVHTIVGMDPALDHADSATSAAWSVAAGRHLGDQFALFVDVSHASNTGLLVGLDWLP